MMSRSRGEFGAAPAPAGGEGSRRARKLTGCAEGSGGSLADQPPTVTPCSLRTRTATAWATRGEACAPAPRAASAVDQDCTRRRFTRHRGLGLSPMLSKQGSQESGPGKPPRVPDHHGRRGGVPGRGRCRRHGPGSAETFQSPWPGDRAIKTVKRMTLGSRSTSVRRSSGDELDLLVEGYPERDGRVELCCRAGPDEQGAPGGELSGHLSEVVAG
jgi:hypothetical protein